MSSTHDFLSFVALRFGVYLDSIQGYVGNLNQVNQLQSKANVLTKIPLAELDIKEIILGGCFL